MKESPQLIYNRLVADERLKSGDAYERLAAIAFRILLEKTTIHDLRLTGQSGARHQIDVVVGHGTQTRRVLVECKELGRRVHLPQVRNFFGAVSDIKPDEAFLLSTIGFSTGAIQFAERNGIRLAIFRPPDGNADWQDLVRRVVVDLRMSVLVGEPRLEFEAVPESPDDINAESVVSRTDETLLVGPDGQETPISHLIDSAYGKCKPGEEGEYVHFEAYDPPRKLVIDNVSKAQVRSAKCTVQVGVATERIETGEGIGGVVAELVLRTLDGEVHRMFTNRQICEWRIEDHLVAPKSDGPGNR